MRKCIRLARRTGVSAQDYNPGGEGVPELRVYENKIAYNCEQDVSPAGSRDGNLVDTGVPVFG